MKTEIQKAKDKAWKAISRYIRHKECLETTGDVDYGICCTCGKLKHRKELQAGHYISGRTNSILFVEDGIHIQCVHCNMFNEGNKSEYEKYMLKRYGKEKCDRLKDLKHIRKSLNLFELKAIEQEYKEKFKNLNY
ncbi:MAG: recombination protein NinG [Eubacteriales bacterium]|nr:recombination protein NinG [Eubacteriales bacterium]